MRRNSSSKSSSATRRRGVLRMLADTQTGFTIIEVVVASVMLTMMAGAVATALISTATVSGDQRRRSQADEIAQQDQERMKGMSIKSLQGLNETRTVGPYEGTSFTVHSTGQFLSNTGSPTCSTAGTSAAAFVRITSTVNWPGNLKAGADINDFSSWTANSIRPPIKQESLIAPRTGGTLLVNVGDETGAPVGGTTINIFGSKENETADTSSEGCAVFGGLVPGGYYIGAQKTGYVDPNGNNYPFTGATAGSGTTAPTPFKMGLAGNVSASFKTTIGGNTYTGQKAPSISWFNAGMTASKNFTPTTVPATPVNPTPDAIYPFKDPTTGYTNNYTVWAGKCDAAKPAQSGDQTPATVTPGATPSVVVKEPALVIKMSYVTSGSYRTPNHVKLTDSCGQAWSIPVADIRPYTDSQFGTFGTLNFPGQPSGTYTVCVDYDPPGAVTSRVVSASSVANTSFTAGNPANLLVTDTSPGGVC